MHLQTVCPGVYKITLTAWFGLNCWGVEFSASRSCPNKRLCHMLLQTVQAFTKNLTGCMAWSRQVPEASGLVKLTRLGPLSPSQLLEGEVQCIA